MSQSIEKKQASMADSSFDSAYDSYSSCNSADNSNSLSSTSSQPSDSKSIDMTSNSSQSYCHTTQEVHTSSEQYSSPSFVPHYTDTEAYGPTTTSMDSGIDCGGPSTITCEKPARKSLSTRTSSNTSRHFTGTALQFLQLLLTVADYRSWDPIKDIKERAGPELLEECRSLMWDQDEEDKEFEALEAARDADERVVAFALYTAKSHKQLNTMNADRQTVLHIAAERCSAHLCRLLITRGCDGAIADVWGDTPLHIAARCGRADVIKALSTTLTKPEVHHPYFRVPYKSLPQDNVQSYNHDGRTPIHLAAQEANSAEHREAIRALVRYSRADIDYRRMGDGYAPAHIAIDNDDLECLRVCLRVGADSEVRNFKSETPQQLAFLFDNKNENSEMVKECQKYGAGVYQLDYAVTESALDGWEDMDVEEECSSTPMDQSLSNEMNKMAMT